MRTETPHTICDSAGNIDAVGDRLDRVRDRLARLVDAMSDPAFELDTIEAAGVIAAYRLARGVGYPTQGLADALVGVLERQMSRTDDGYDGDVSVDDGQEAA